VRVWNLMDQEPVFASQHPVEVYGLWSPQVHFGETFFNLLHKL
jgi:hypothetical protein